MKYLCLLYDDERVWATMSKTDIDAVMGDYFAFTSGIQASGQYVAGEALEPTQTATTVRVRHGKAVATDGPFAETKEQLGGFYLIDAPNLEAALTFAAGIPDARTGTVELRPIK